MSAHTRTLLSYLRRVTAPAVPDAALLTRWINQRDQDAFAALMARHGPMVLGVCRRLLGDEQEAEDAFQAVFLVLARRATRVRRPEALAGFLYTVARRLARKTRAAAKRRPAVQNPPELPEPVDPRPHPLDLLSGRELLALLDAEIARLPERYRLPLVLCLLQGQTIEEAARQLGWSIGSLRGRLTRGRERLRQRLLRRGLDLSVGAAALLAPVAVPEKLLAESLHHLSGSIPDAISTLAGGMMPAVKLKLIGLALVIVTAVGLGAGFALQNAPKPEAPAAPSSAAPPAQATDEPRRDLFGDPLPPGAIARLGTLRFRFDADIQRIALTPDGKTIAAVSNTGIGFVDVASGKLIRRVRTSDYSSRGATTAMGLGIGGSFVSDIAFSPNGKRFAVYGWAQMGQQKFRLNLDVWEWHEDSKQWQQARKLRKFEIATSSPAWTGWSAEGQLLAAYTGKGEIIVHEIETGRKQHFAVKDLPDVLHDSVYRFAAGKTILAAADDKNILHIFDLTEGKKCHTFQAGHRVFFLALSSDCRWLASISQQAHAAIHLWDLTTGKARQTIAAGQKDLLNIVFTPDSKTLATISTSEVRFWDVASGQERSRIKNEVRVDNTRVAFTPDSKTMIAAEQNSGCLHRWDVATGELKPQPEGHSSHHPGKAAFSPDGQRVATPGDWDGTVRVWNLETGRLLTQVRRSGCWVSTCAFSADGRTLFSCWSDRILTSDSDTGRELYVWKLEDPDQPEARQRAIQLHLSDDRRRLLIFSYGSRPTEWKDWLLTGWDVTTRKHLFRPRLAFQGDLWIAVSADAHLLALPAVHKGDSSMFHTGLGPMRLQDVETGERLATFPDIGDQTRTRPLTFSPDGRLLVSHTWHTERPPGPHDRGQTLRVWEVLTTGELLALPTTDGHVEAAISPAGRLLAALTPRGEIILRDLRTGKEMRRFQGFNAEVTSLAFSPDGRRLVSGLSDSTLLVWDVGPPLAAPVEKLGADGVAKAWIDLAGTDAPRAFHARGKLASAPEQAIPLLRKHLHSAQSADPQRLRRLLADLDSEQFAVREKAQEELVKLGDLAEPALRQTLASKPSLEMRRRVQTVLERLRGPVKQPELLQALRAVAVLEDIGIPEARRMLEELTKGAAESRLTREVKESLQRLERRRPSLRSDHENRKLAPGS